MGRRRSDQSAMSLAFNPHPSVRRGAILRIVCICILKKTFQSSPPREEGCYRVPGMLDIAVRVFQSSPPREEGCYPDAILRHAMLNALSILTPP